MTVHHRPPPQVRTVNKPHPQIMTVDWPAQQVIIHAQRLQAALPMTGPVTVTLKSGVFVSKMNLTERWLDVITYNVQYSVSLKIEQHQTPWGKWYCPLCHQNKKTKGNLCVVNYITYDYITPLRTYIHVCVANNYFQHTHMYTFLFKWYNWVTTVTKGTTYCYYLIYCWAFTVQKWRFLPYKRENLSKLEVDTTHRLAQVCIHVESQWTCQAKV